MVMEYFKLPGTKVQSWKIAPQCPTKRQNCLLINMRQSKSKIKRCAKFQVH
uniref:Uncharacterized protein n=1 Tax=Anguilla anguilla TaxID=7936 RepID=A0A0E9W346_ANGAN